MRAPAHKIEVSFRNDEKELEVWQWLKDKIHYSGFVKDILYQEYQKYLQEDSDLNQPRNKDTNQSSTLNNLFTLVEVNSIINTIITSLTAANNSRMLNTSPQEFNYNQMLNTMPQPNNYNQAMPNGATQLYNQMLQATLQQANYNQMPPNNVAYPTNHNPISDISHQQHHYNPLPDVASQPYNQMQRSPLQQINYNQTLKDDAYPTNYNPIPDPVSQQVNYNQQPNVASQQMNNNPAPSNIVDQPANDEIDNSQPLIEPLEKKNTAVQSKLSTPNKNPRFL